MENIYIRLLKDCTVENHYGRDVLFSEGDQFIVDEYSMEDYNDPGRDRFGVEDDMDLDNFVLYKDDEGELWEVVKD